MTDFPTEAIELEPIPEKRDLLSFGALLWIGFFLGFLVTLAAMT